MDYNTLKFSDTNIKTKNRNKKNFKFDISMYKKEILLKKLGNKLEKKLKVHLSKPYLIKTLKHANNIFSHYFSREIQEIFLLIKTIKTGGVVVEFKVLPDYKNLEKNLRDLEYKTLNGNYSKVVIFDIKKFYCANYQSICL
tara:strand:+ start:6901 stop:7323 length:423 start_codon:yes stop_codon:yes gene_type:complete